MRKANLFLLNVLWAMLFTWSPGSYALDYEEILDNLPPARCNESVFKPCICHRRVPEDIIYRTNHPLCNNRAAAILKGDFRESFSIVLRDKLNRDRVAPIGFNNCTQAEIDAGLSKCSIFKAQKVIRTLTRTIHCFGLPGVLMSKATRMTIKLADRPNSSDDPLVRVCLNGNGTSDLN
jgi:hypothetical protein